MERDDSDESADFDELERYPLEWRENLRPEDLRTDDSTDGEWRVWTVIREYLFPTEKAPEQ